MFRLIRLDSHVFIYRGFTILRLQPRKPYRGQRYQITHDDHYLGIDFALEEACGTIDRIMNNNCFTFSLVRGGNGKHTITRWIA